MADVQKGFANLAESVKSNVPAGSESALALFNNAVNASQASFVSAQNTAKQAVEAAQANYSAFTAQAVDAVKNMGEATK